MSNVSSTSLNRDSGVTVRPMRPPDLTEARRIFRVAFGSFLGLANPEAFSGDKEYVFTRFGTDPDAALSAEAGGRLVGSNFLSRWGSFGFFGPLTVLPEMWNRGVARALLGPTIDLFDQWGIRDAGLFTFAHSPKHIALYQKFGFWPRFLTALMSKEVAARATPLLEYSSLVEARQEKALRACTELAGRIHAGLDLASEIRGCQRQNLGETVLSWAGDRLDGFAICHCGPGTEAGSNICYIKFAASVDETAFDRLLDGCESLAAQRKLTKLEAGVNLGRSRAYRRMLEKGFRANMQGVAMQKPDSPAYNRPDVFIADDWR